MSPHASVFSTGGTTETPKDSISRSYSQGHWVVSAGEKKKPAAAGHACASAWLTCFAVRGWLHMCVFIAGHTIKGLLVSQALEAKEKHED